jgi:hypothetical protein
MQDIDGTNSCLRVDDGRTVALKDLTDVRITAVVKSDERVVYDAPREETAGSSVTMTETVRDGEYRRVKRDSSSAYWGDGTGVIRNDATDDGPMKEAVARLREKTEARRDGLSVTVPWVDVSYRVGERVSDIEGRSMAFASKPGDDPSYPKIGRVAYDFSGQRTEIQLRPARS